MTGSSGRVAARGQAALAGGGRGGLAFAGPAVIASIAYMDPGNFATNIQAGAQYGPALLWVVVLANLVAMLFQAFSARLGIVSGRSLAALSRERFGPAVRWPMWVVSEVAAMATDLAEFLGASLAVNLLFGIPLLPALVVVAVVTYGLLLLGNLGFRPTELVIAAFVAVIGICYVLQLVVAPPDWAAVLGGMVTPRLPDGGGGAAGGGHRRCHGDAARDLPACEPDERPHRPGGCGTDATADRVLQP